LRTGYYTPEHPESKRAKEGLYDRFKSLFVHEDELTFLVREDQERQEIWVEGILPEPQRLSRMMLKGMGELYVPKFSHYLERKDLTTLTLKSRMGSTEFIHFIDIMSDPSLLDIRRKQDKEQFAQALDNHGIINISYVFNEELLAPDREMPWRARVTLSRMRKDLRMTPLFQKMTGQQIQEIRKNLVWDTLRPLRHFDLLCAVLRNSDLAATAEHQEDIIESEIVSFCRKQYLLGIAKIFLREHLGLKQLRKGDAFERKSDRLVKKISYRLKEEGTKETETLLEEFFRHELIALEDLTPGLKDKILLERLTDKFLKYTDQFFEQIDRAKEKESFLDLAHSFVRMIPELIRRDRYPEILHILETLKRHFHEKRMWALLAGQVIEEIGQGTIPHLLQERFITAKKEVRTAIIPIFISLEIGAIPSLLSILKTSEDQWVRKNACEAMIQIGPVAAIHLLKELEAQQTSIETTRDILRVLGEIKSQEWKTPLLKILKKYVTHEHPKLREQGIHTLCQIGGIEGEETFLSSLDDPDLEVRKRAVWCLGMIKSAKGIEKMMEILKQISTTPSPQMDELETQVYHAFGIAGNLTIKERTLEQTLLEVLEKRGMKRWWDLSQKNLLTDAALGTICDALGRIGTKESINVLTKLGKTREGPWTPKLKEALKKIEERTVVRTK
jgi:succinate dehydrogenase flavin-adding protein (antitoxin of CptAB toxin-antitoxin module)